MDFTREPIIETVITPKEGFKLVVRSSKSTAQEEYFVDAVEVVSFGHSFFFRSLERPKSFLVPVTDYEILEVREARMVLKNVGLDRSIKIGGGREGNVKAQREIPQEKAEAPEEVAETVPPEPRLEKRRDKRRHTRRRRSRETETTEEGESKIDIEEPTAVATGESATAEPLTTSSTILSSILPPPPTLISETIARYKENAMFKGAFFMNDDEKEKQEEESEDEEFHIAIEEPHLGPFEMTPQEEADIYQHRTSLIPPEPPESSNS